MKRDSVQIDATGKAPGRLAVEVATHLIGKNKPTYTPHIDDGAAVEVVNIDKMVPTGKKMEQKMYYKHPGYPGNLKEKKMEKLWEEGPEKILIHAVKNMIPNNRLRNGRLKRLTIK